MVHHRNLILLAVVAFILIFSIASVQAKQPVSPGNPALSACLAQVEQLQKIIADQQTTIGTLRDQINTLLESLNAKDQTIAGQQATIGALQQQINTLQASLDAKEQTIAEQEAMIVELQEQIDTLEALYGHTCNGTLSAGGRWCDNLDGTIMDMNTGLIWMKNASCMSATWYDGLKWVAETVAHGVCGLTDGSYMGDWRIPTEQELYKITQGVESVQCSRCHETSFFFVDVNSCHYWANSTHGSPDTAYSIGMATHGGQQGYYKATQSLPILPVRNRK